MQSVLQYRRFKRHVAVQYERSRRTASADHHHEEPVQSRTSSSALGNIAIPVSEPLPHDRDPEKAESFNDQDLGKAESVNDSGSDEQRHISDVLASEGPEDVQREGGRPHMLRAVSTTRTQASMGTNIGNALTGILVRTRTTRDGGNPGKVFVVGYEGENDTMNPHNWSLLTRWGATCKIASIGWVVGFASSIDSAALPQAAAEFGVSEVTESLATGLFLSGFGCGALVAGPISETVGRNPVYIMTLTLYMIFIMASGLAPNIGSQLAFRFLAGLFGSTPLTCAGGSISDLWSPMERVYAFPVFANAAFMGPIFGKCFSLLDKHFHAFYVLRRS